MGKRKNFFELCLAIVVIGIAVFTLLHTEKFASGISKSVLDVVICFFITMLLIMAIERIFDLITLCCGKKVKKECCEKVAKQAHHWNDEVEAVSQYRIAFLSESGKFKYARIPINARTKEIRIGDKLPFRVLGNRYCFDLQVFMNKSELSIEVQQNHKNL